MTKISSEIYKDENRSYAERAVDLVSRMTLEEKIMQLGNNAASIPRLGIPAYNYWSEASHGFFGPMEFEEMDVTSYPVCLAMSQTWDKEAVRKVAEAISTECRALHNTKGIELHMWCPTVNLARDPRNGRSDENFGEDPLLAGELGAAYVQGMQGEDERCLRTIATPKHFAVNSSENNRHTGSSNIDEATLREYYADVFCRVVEQGKPASIMTSYNRINGVPASVNEQLLTTLLREEWGFDGFVVSDCGAVADCYSNPMFLVNGSKSHFYCRNMEEASAMSLIAGTDMSCGNEHKKSLLKAFQSGMIEEDILDRALVRIFISRFRLGLFDAPELDPYHTLGEESVANDDMAALSVKVAADSMVLLKNEKNLLPLNPSDYDNKKILIVGPNAIYRELGGYSAGQTALVDTKVNVLALEGIRNALSETQAEVVYEKGWCSGTESKDGGFMGMLPGLDLSDMTMDILPEGGDFMKLGMAFMKPPRHAANDPDANVDNEILFARALAAAEEADLVIVIAGTDNTNASEEKDRTTLALPYDQDEKIQKLLEKNANTIVVLETLGAVTGEFFKQAHTLINAHFAGQAQGQALADVLFGKVNPNAKLTATWYKSEDDLPHINDYGLKEQDTLDGKKRTYQYFTDPVLFPFGYGLSYTSYAYSNLSLSQTTYDANDAIQASVTVTNTGERDGSEIVQLYVSKVLPEKVRDNKPIRQLKAFEKVFLKAGESKTITMQIPVREIRFWSNFHQKMEVENGVYRIEVGPDSANLSCSTEITIDGEWEPQLQSVYALSDKVLFRPGERGTITVSATLEDARHLRSGEYTTIFHTHNDSVAEVDEKGNILARGKGVTTITVSVSRGGKTLTSDIPVAVCC